jgi:glutaredoxin
MKVVVWSKENCPQCDKSKQLLTSMGIPYEERVVGGGYTRDDLLAEVPMARSVPQIFINGEYIGGHLELVSKLAA